MDSHIKGTYLRLDFKGPASSLTQAEHEKFRRQHAVNDCFNVLDKCSGEEKRSKFFSFEKTF